MKYDSNDLKRDVERIQQIAIIPTILDVVCQITGMGFAAVARVTDDRWITCSVKDDINFGLVPGSELRIETTICNEIRDSHQPVIIENVKESELFCNHHTPQMYGFQSYISYPIILKTGEFFGTLCAIDPQPRSVQNDLITGTFAAFTELIAFHLQQVTLLEHEQTEVKSLNRRLVNSEDENRQYRHIADHTLQEPLRKIRVFSGMLLDALSGKKIEQASELAQKIQKAAEKFSALIQDLTHLSSFGDGKDAFKLVDFEHVIHSVASRFRAELLAKDGTVSVAKMPVMKAVPQQIEQLFFQLFDNAVKFARPDVPLRIAVTSKEYLPNESDSQLSLTKKYCQISFADNGIGIDKLQLNAIFDVFSQLPTEVFLEGSGIGLPVSRRIVRNHFGQINIESDPGQGTTVHIVLPTD